MKQRNRSDDKGLILGANENLKKKLLDKLNFGYGNLRILLRHT